LPSQQFTAAELEAMEMIILQASDWNMVTVVPANYTEKAEWSEAVEATRLEE